MRKNGFLKVETFEIYVLVKRYSVNAFIHLTMHLITDKYFGELNRR